MRKVRVGELKAEAAQVARLVVGERHAALVVDGCVSKAEKPRAAAAAAAAAAAEAEAAGGVDSCTVGLCEAYGNEYVLVDFRMVEMALGMRWLESLWGSASKLGCTSWDILCDHGRAGDVGAAYLVLEIGGVPHSPSRSAAGFTTRNLDRGLADRRVAAASSMLLSPAGNAPASEPASEPAPPAILFPSAGARDPSKPRVLSGADDAVDMISRTLLASCVLADPWDSRCTSYVMDFNDADVFVPIRRLFRGATLEYLASLKHLFESISVDFSTATICITVNPAVYMLPSCRSDAAGAFVPYSRTGLVLGKMASGGAADGGRGRGSNSDSDSDGEVDRAEESAKKRRVGVAPPHTRPRHDLGSLTQSTT